MTATTDKPFDERRSAFNEWETIGVEALGPGWVNVYELDMSTNFALEPCPAILLEQCTVTVHCWDELVDGHIVRMSRREEHPRILRAVFASEDCGEITPAPDMGGYVTTTTREEWDRRDGSAS